MLNTLTVIGAQVFLDLALVVGAFVDRNADLAARARHRFAFQPRQLAFDVEVANLAEIKQPLVEASPFLHSAAMYVVCQLIDVAQACALRMLVSARQRYEIDIVNRYSGA